MARRAVFFALAIASLIGTSSVQAAEDALRIGVLTDMTGPYSDNAGAGSVVAARMAVEDFGSTVLGHSIDVVFADHMNKPDVAASIARRWLDVDGVDAIVDVPGSALALAVQQITRERHRVFLISGAGTSDLTGVACSPTSIHWTWDTYSFGRTTARAVTQLGGLSWFFLSVDTALGSSLERDTRAAVEQAGGTVVGAARHPLGTGDFSAYLLQAQASKAKVLAFLNGGTDAANSIKQANEFGLRESGQILVGLGIQIHDTRALGLQVTQGMLVTQAFYWDRDGDTRAFARRFAERQGGMMPTDFQAGVYSSVSHYLRAVRDSGSKDGDVVVRKMKDTPVHDFFAPDGRVREDGRMVHDMYLLRTKRLEQSRGPWDLYEIAATVPGDQAFRPESEGGCELVQPARRQ